MRPSGERAEDIAGQIPRSPTPRCVNQRTRRKASGAYHVRRGTVIKRVESRGRVSSARAREGLGRNLDGALDSELGDWRALPGSDDYSTPRTERPAGFSKVLRASPGAPPILTRLYLVNHIDGPHFLESFERFSFLTAPRFSSEFPDNSPTLFPTPPAPRPWPPRARRKPNSRGKSWWFSTSFSTKKALLTGPWD